MKALILSAKIISAIFNPLAVPTYGMVIALQCSSLTAVNLKAKLAATAVVAILTGLLPLLFIHGLKRLSLVKDLDLSDRKERTLPFSVALCLYVAAVVYLYTVSAPAWLIGFLIGAAVALLITLIVSRHWKISAHAAAVGGLVAMTAALIVRNNALGHFFQLMPLMMVVLIGAGLVCCARLILQSHTPLQVLAGFANGFVCVAIFSQI